MRRKIACIAGVAALVVSGILLSATPTANAAVPREFPGQAQAARTDPAPCTNWSAWQAGGTDWGQFRYCADYDASSNTQWWRFQVDDTKTDGYAVHLELCHDSWPSNYCTGGPIFGDLVHATDGGLCVESTGAVVTSSWYGIFQYLSPDPSHLDAKVVKGSCSGTHQNVGQFTYHLSY